jgi:hypothetical protein
MAIVLCGSGSYVLRVFVLGLAIIETGTARPVYEAALLRDVQAEGERLWQAVPDWHFTGKSVDEIVPPSYSIRGDHA